MTLLDIKLTLIKEMSLAMYSCNMTRDIVLVSGIE
jgi:hypothetical protein